MIHLPNVVYLFGAGVNQVAKYWDGISPPLLSNFFNVALSMRRFRDDHYSKQLESVYGYIEKYFRKTKDELAKSPFDLETCFTQLVTFHAYIGHVCMLKRGLQSCFPQN